MPQYSREFARSITVALILRDCCRVQCYLNGSGSGGACQAHHINVNGWWRLGPAAELPSRSRLHGRAARYHCNNRTDSSDLSLLAHHWSTSQVSNQPATGISHVCYLLRCIVWIQLGSNTEINDVFSIQGRDIVIISITNICLQLELLHLCVCLYVVGTYDTCVRPQYVCFFDMGLSYLKYMHA